MAGRRGAAARPDVVDTLGLAVLAARAFEVMLDRWCGLGLWEYRAGFEAGVHRRGRVLLRVPDHGGDVSASRTFLIGLLSLVTIVVLVLVMR